ncbi:MAG: carbon-nitrogen hydrolase family protein [Planctomycetota bacterium]
MKIAVAQTRPSIGPVEGNLAGHQSLIDVAVRNGAGLIVFPELSLTGYEPRMAASFARTRDDSCFKCLQTTANQSGITIAAGVPTRGHRLPRISTLLFRPESEIQVYSKQFLHADEEPFFEPGPTSDGLMHENPAIALAICYELSVPLHAQRAMDSGASVYIASVAKTSRGVDVAGERLSKIARDHSMLVMMANCLGLLDGAECVGRSSVWSRSGNQLMQLETEHEGAIILDDETEDVVVVTLNASSQ